MGSEAQKNELKPETLELIKGNQLNTENLWLAKHIEKKTKLQFDLLGTDDMEARSIQGVLVALGVYNYLVVAASKEMLINKAAVQVVFPA